MLKSLALRNDAIGFIGMQLQKLPQETQYVLKIAACIGNKFDLDTLARVCQKSTNKTIFALQKALQYGLIATDNKAYNIDFELTTRLSESAPPYIPKYYFLHNQFHEALYAAISDAEKQAIHYQIGRCRLQKIPTGRRKFRIFELVNQLNSGKDLDLPSTERNELAELNLIACLEAKNTTAYEAGLKYANIGLSLLEENAWQSQYSMSLSFHELAAEFAGSCGDFEAMEKFSDIVIARAYTILEKVNVYRIKIQSNTSQGKLTQAIDIAQEILQQLGIEFPKAPTQKDIQQAIAEIDKVLGEREIEDLVNLPVMKDAKKMAIVEIACSVLPAAYISGSPLFPLLVALSVKLSIQYGNTLFSGSAYAPFGILACNMNKDVEKGVKFGQLALELVSKLDAEVVKPEVINVVGSFILHRKFHITQTLPLLKEGYSNGLKVGNLEFVGYIAHNFCLNSFWSSQPLSSLEQETRAYCKNLVQLNQVTTANWCQIYWQSVLNLLGCAENPSILSGEALQEVEFLSRLHKSHDFGGLFIFHSYKLMLCYLFGNIEYSQDITVDIRSYLIGASGIVIEPAFYLYDSLTALSSQSKNKADILQQVEQNQTQLRQQWAYYAPMNHQHKVDLVEAEKYRVLGQHIEASELYSKAISGAKAYEYIQEEALANELAAKFYLDGKQEQIAADYMKEAYCCYARWGAKAKTDDLEKRYPKLLLSS
ncbi:hypothetical protein Riv7116_4806 [Rivularia sp. PCC 7116]|uniref:ATP-binding protein n=1 Tax=Rivularia sp. PCC 7116 TaxID=373994 RepID=UPI00029F2233|nr:hypothetical protein [Rivularia sp. PCC 7116]AFY57219.1 hypothetical protein Riv7116_4806 [Rivularia sp. PCC 7116]